MDTTIKIDVIHVSVRFPHLLTTFLVGTGTTGRQLVTNQIIQSEISILATNTLIYFSLCPFMLKIIPCYFSYLPRKLIMRGLATWQV